MNKKIPVIITVFLIVLTITSLYFKNDITAGLFVDGKYIVNLTFGNKISIKKSSKTLVFLREKTTNLYYKLKN